mmetsp:Transcript_13847/g.26881  ORF Transcript_13847/g.26881 Transcript_13847/m.26881 type:complete len:206 (+) Transcript_13847:1272-1889(+)
MKGCLLQRLVTILIYPRPLPTPSDLLVPPVNLLSMMTMSTEMVALVAPLLLQVDLVKLFAILVTVFLPECLLRLEVLLLEVQEMPKLVHSLVVLLLDLLVEAPRLLDPLLAWVDSAVPSIVYRCEWALADLLQGPLLALEAAHHQPQRLLHLLSAAPGLLQALVEALRLPLDLLAVAWSFRSPTVASEAALLHHLLPVEVDLVPR